jgi:hypothetical protein
MRGIGYVRPAQTMQHVQLHNIGLIIHAATVQPCYDGLTVRDIACELLDTLGIALLSVYSHINAAHRIERSRTGTIMGERI